MYEHKSLNQVQLLALIRKGNITLGGNKKLKIYGALHCASGKRMLKENRVFFNSIQEANSNNYRPCGHCMRQEYKTWKDNGSL